MKSHSSEPLLQKHVDESKQNSTKTLTCAADSPRLKRQETA